MNLQMDPGERLGHSGVDLGVCLKDTERCEPQIRKDVGNRLPLKVIRFLLMEACEQKLASHCVHNNPTISVVYDNESLRVMGWE